MNKKLIIGIIIVIILGSVSVYAGSKFYASDVSVTAPTGSNLGSDATLQGTLDELYSIADKYDELNTKINSLESTMLDKIYPVGSIYISTDITTESDVAKKFGGTWEKYASGRTLVGVDTNDTDFNSSSKTGGKKDTTLEIANLPSHSHNIPSLSGVTSDSGSHQQSLYMDQYGTSYLLGNGLFETPSSNVPGFVPNGGWSKGQQRYGTVNTTSSAPHHHSFNTEEGVTSKTGSGTSFTNLQPYITVYMYKRIK